MAHCATFLEETGDILGVSLALPEAADTIGLNFTPKESASLDLSTWPLVTIYRSISLPAPLNLWEHYLRVLSLNLELQESTLACDEAGAPYLVQSFDASFQNPADLAACVKEFSILGAQIPDRFAALDVPGDSPAEARNSAYAVQPFLPADHLVPV